MTRDKYYHSNEQSETDSRADDATVLEAGLPAALRPFRRDDAGPPVSALRRVHSSLYTLQAYKRWMHQIRENWKNDKP